MQNSPNSKKRLTKHKHTFLRVLVLIQAVRGCRGPV
jgi:hypothetical protein